MNGRLRPAAPACRPLSPSARTAKHRRNRLRHPGHADRTLVTLVLRRASGTGLCAADRETVSIGERSNVQDGCVLHAVPGVPLSVG